MDSQYQKFKDFLQTKKDSSSVEAVSCEERAYHAVKNLNSKKNPPPQSPAPTGKGRRRPGRPMKADEEKVRMVSMKLSPESILEIKNLPFGRGVGSKVRELLAFFKRQEKKEMARAKLLEKLLAPFDKKLNHYLKVARTDPQSSEACGLFNELVKMGEQIQTIVDIIHWDHSDFKNYLHRDHVLTLQFVLDLKKEMSENRSFQHIL